MTGLAIARWWRTVRPLRSRQIAALVRHRLRGGVVSPPWEGPPPQPRAIAPPARFLGAPEHAVWEAGAGIDGASRLRLLNREVRFHGPVDWDLEECGPLWAVHLHQFDYLRRHGLEPAARAELILDWIARHGRGRGWSPYPTSQRTLVWSKLLLSPGALALDADAERRVLSSLGRQLSTLAAHRETHLLANHLLSNLLALVLGGLVFEGREADRWLAHDRELRAELAEQILPDGAHIERSPMYHSLLLESVLDLANAAAAAPGRAPAELRDALREAAARMLGALRVWTLPDDRIALFGDSAFGIAQEPAELEHYARALGIAPRPPARDGVLDAAGFVRLAAGPLSVIASLAGPMPAYQPGHAHADALSFELSVGRDRVVTDTGVYEYAPGARRDASRATAAHATIEVGGCDQAELWAAHRVGGRPRVSRVAVEAGGMAEGTCAGWATPDTLHRRRFRLDADRLEIRDSIEGRSRPVRFSLPLAPGLEPELADRSATLTLPGGARLAIELPEGAVWRTERAPYFPEFGRALERAVLVGEARSFRSGDWTFRLER